MISKTFWHGKSVLVSGGSSGIGRELGIAAAAAGARVGLIARREAALADAAAVIRAAGGGVATAVCDVADASAMAGAVTALEHSLGPAAVAIACAGIHRVSWPLDAERAKAVFDTNITGTSNLLAAVLPGMVRRGGGRLCGVASVAAVVGLRENAAYCASKAAVVAFLESLRVDCAAHGIRVTTACPGFVDTPMITAAERASGHAMPAAAAARRILRAIERGRAETWFPAGTAVQAHLLRLLPTGLRDAILRRLAPMREA